jgi:hypothetical protein
MATVSESGIWHRTYGEEAEIDLEEAREIGGRNR